MGEHPDCAIAYGDEDRYLKPGEGRTHSDNRSQYGQWEQGGFRSHLRGDNDPGGIWQGKSGPQGAERGRNMKDSQTAVDRDASAEKKQDNVVRAASLPERACRRAVRKMRKLLQSAGKRKAPEKIVSSYQERLNSQRDIYGQWIREKEPDLWQQREEARQGGQSRERCGKSCLVVSYGELAGVTELSRIVNAGAVNPKEERMPDILLFAENPEDLDKRAVSYVKGWFGARPAARLLYGAEDHKRGEKRSFPWFKPCFSPDTLLGFFCFGSYFAVDGPWAMRTRLSGYEDARLNLYDFVLRLLRPYYETEKLGVCDRKYTEIAGTDLVLYHRSDTMDFGEPADLESFLYVGTMRGEANPEFWGYEKKYIECRRNLINSICGGSESYQTMCPDVWAVIPAADKEPEDGIPLVSVVIPSKDHPLLLKKCISSFVERTSLPGLREKVEFVVVDNGSGEENRRMIQDYLTSAGIIYQYLYRPMSFNFSAMCNMGAEQAKGTYTLLLNDDIEIIEENWLRILLGQARMPGTGAVGAKLLYPEGKKIQHAGVTNMAVGPSHKLMTFPDDRSYYYGHNTVSYNMIAVTGACLLVKKSVYEEAGGLDEEMAVAYNDVDFCFTLAEDGLRNVVRNDAVLLHHESASRGPDEESAEKWQRLLEEKAKLYKKHPIFLEYDPYYSEQLAGYYPDYRVRCGQICEHPLLPVPPERRDGKRDLKKRRSEFVMLTIDRLKPRNRLNLGDPAVLEAEGWCYMEGWDNCLFQRFLVLESEQEDFYYRFSVKERLRPDVEAILPQQKNIELSGFLCAIGTEDILPGSYRVGMLYRNLCSGKLYYGCSGERLQV